MTAPMLIGCLLLSTASDPVTLFVRANGAYETGDYDDVNPPPQLDPLGISGDQIEDLEATIAPVGSELQDNYQEVEEPQYDLSDLEVAPVGSDLGGGKKEADPPPPDTTGITMAD